LESFSSALSRNSERLDRIMAGLENFTSGDIKSELIDTPPSLRALSDNLDKRTPQISVGPARFSTSGPREYEALARDARPPLADPGRATRNSARTPQRVLLGPSTSDAGTPPEGPPPARAQTPPRRPRAAVGAR